MPLARVNHTELHYHRTGDGGAPVLMIQGVGCAGSAWRPQAENLGRDHRVVYFDNRGIGRSATHRGPLSIELMTDDTLALMDHLGWERAHVVGHSMGGIIAQQLALTARERVRSLGLVSTFASGKVAGRIQWSLLGTMLRMRIGSKRSRRRAFCDCVFPRAYQDRIGRDGLPDRLAELFGRDLATWPAIINVQVRAVKRHDAAAELPELAGIPTLVVKGGLDRVAPPSQSDELVRLIPGAELEEFPDAGHGLPLQYPDEVSDRLREHFASADARDR